jgi:hypothetical protein
VEVVEHVIREPVEIQERISRPLGRLTYEVECVFTKPSVLSCQVDSEDICERSKVEIIERRIIEERTTETWVKVLEWLSAGIVLPIGVLVTVDASYVPDGSIPIDRNPVGRGGAYAIGASITAIGAGLTALAITDSVRALDVIKETSQEEKTLETSENPCEKGAAANRRITVYLPPLRHDVTTDTNGRIELDLELLAPAAEVVTGPKRRSLTLAIGSQEIKQIDISSYVERLFAEEDARRREKQERKKRFELYVQEVESVISKGPSDDCVSWYESTIELMRKDPKSVPKDQLAALADCAAQHIIGLAIKQFDAGLLAMGSATLARADALIPDHPMRAKAFDARERGIVLSSTEALQNSKIQLAKDNLVKCREFGISKATCDGIEEGITRASVIEASTVGKITGIRGILLALPSIMMSRTVLDNLVKGLAVRSGSIPGVEWTPTHSVAQALPKEKEWLKQCFSEADCVLGVLKQFNSNFLVVLTVNPKGKLLEVEERVFQVVGCALEISTRRYEVTAPALQAKSWDSLRSELANATGRAQVCHELKPEEGTETAPGEARATTNEDVTVSEFAPYSNFDIEALFATDEDVLPPPNCSQVLTDTPDVRVPSEGGVFKRPRVLLLDLDVKAPGGIRAVDGALAKGALRYTLMNTFRMKRNDYVVPCEKVSLDSIRGQKLYGVDFVIHLALMEWKEETTKDSGQIDSVDTKLAMRVWDVREGSWKEYFNTDLSVPSWIDSGVFMAEDTKKQAIDNAIKETGLEKGVELATDLIKKTAGGRVQPKLDDPKKDWYVHKLKQSLGMSGKKLAVALAKQKDFRLTSPVIAREEDEVAVGIGEREGVRLCDTYLFSRRGPDDWEGFGRVNHIGMGGAQGVADPSKVEVIADYDCADDEITVFEYPVVGIVAGLSFGLMPVKHDWINFSNGDSVDARALGMPGLALDVRWRIPWLPITELYQTNRFNYIIDPPVILFTIDPGFEWRWFWGRFSPVVGLRYSLGIIGIPVRTRNGEDTTATALTHGIEPYLGFYIFLHPAWTMSLHFGWRQYFSKPSKFEKDDVQYEIRKADESVWKVDLSGPFAVLGFTYEY